MDNCDIRTFSEDKIMALFLPFPMILYINPTKTISILTSIMKQIPKSYLQFYKYLIEVKGIDQNLGIMHEKVLTPIKAACINDDVPTVQYLIEQRHVNYDLNYLISNSCKFGSAQVVKYLIGNNSFDINTDINGRNLLHFSCMKGELIPSQEKHLLLVKYLIEQMHANINSQCSDNGYTALHYAKESDFKDITKYLISKGADQTIKNKDGKVPKSIKVKQKQNEQKCRI